MSANRSTSAVRRNFLGYGIAATFMVCASLAQAQGGKPLTIMLPYGPGGATDLLARSMEPGLRELLDRPVIIEFKPGVNKRGEVQTVVVSAGTGGAASFKLSWDYEGKTYTTVTLRGSNNPTGVTCTGASANTICQALRTGTAMSGISCGGRTWNIGGCGGGTEAPAENAAGEHRAGEDAALDVGAQAGERGHVVAVRHADHVLLDDRARVELLGDVVRGGADQLHAAVVRLVVGLGALETGQEAVVDVDGPATQELAELGRQDLHVARQHDQVDAQLTDELFNLQLLLALGFEAGAGGQLQVMEGDAVALHQLGEVGVVGHDGRDIHPELAAAPAEQQVIEAVAVLADHDQHARLARQRMQLQAHAELVAHVREQLVERAARVHPRVACC